MKKDIHPTYYPNAKVICVCGNSFEAGSTESEIKVEVCAACHPFYTGKQKLFDAARRVEKFEAKLGSKSTTAIKSKKTKRATRDVVKKAKAQGKEEEAAKAKSTAGEEEK
jgi:large subunit ribosomal protein L31